MLDALKTREPLADDFGPIEDLVLGPPHNSDIGTVEPAKGEPEGVFDSLSYCAIGDDLTRGIEETRSACAALASDDAEIQPDPSRKA